MRGLKGPTGVMGVHSEWAIHLVYSWGSRIWASNFANMVAERRVQPRPAAVEALERGGKRGRGVDGSRLKSPLIGRFRAAGKPMKRRGEKSPMVNAVKPVQPPPGFETRGVPTSNVGKFNHNDNNNNIPTFNVGKGGPSGEDWRNEVMGMMWGFAQGFKGGGKGKGFGSGEYMPGLDEKHLRKIDKWAGDRTKFRGWMDEG